MYRRPPPARNPMILAVSASQVLKSRTVHRTKPARFSLSVIIRYHQSIRAAAVTTAKSTAVRKAARVRAYIR